ncbi:MAG: hypothetical protein HC924_02735 [Synechococcaceae cyanobacterium SM2_3_2]|nr:hypothetical protein [Synechococcaceae cyanobacterium SM2_3_2]
MGSDHTSTNCPWLSQPQLSAMAGFMLERLLLSGAGVASLLAWGQIATAQTWSIPSPEWQVAQALSAPTLDDSLQDLRTTFTQIEGIQLPDIATSAPGYTIVNPTGYGTSFGTVFFAVGGVFEGRNQEDGVAGLGVGIGLGDPNQAVGVDLSYTITNLEEGFGGANVKLHRNLYQGEAVGVAAAVGLDDFFTTGDLDQDPSIYATTSIIFKTNPDINEFFSRLAFTLGAGNGRFRREEDILSDQDAIGFFGSGALRVTRSVSVITEWTGQDIAAGFSVAPFRDINFYITPALRDIAGDGDGVRFSLGAGLSLQF